MKNLSKCTHNHKLDFFLKAIICTREHHCSPFNKLLVQHTHLTLSIKKISQ